jgi:hypothetical protein
MSAQVLRLPHPLHALEVPRTPRTPMRLSPLSPLSPAPRHSTSGFASPTRTLRIRLAPSAAPFPSATIQFFTSVPVCVSLSVPRALHALSAPTQPLTRPRSTAHATARDVLRAVCAQRPLADAADFALSLDGGAPLPADAPLPLARVLRGERELVCARVRGPASPATPACQTPADICVHQ